MQELLLYISFLLSSIFLVLDDLKLFALLAILRIYAPRETYNKDGYYYYSIRCAPRETYNKDGYYYYSIREWKGVSFVVKAHENILF